MKAQQILQNSHYHIYRIQQADAFDISKEWGHTCFGVVLKGVALDGSHVYWHEVGPLFMVGRLPEAELARGLLKKFTKTGKPLELKESLVLTLTLVD